jgi:putative transcriptional regulator
LIDFDFSNNAQPEKGSLLISEPFLTDDYFARSVIYLCDHNEDGSYGFVLNKFIETNLTEIVEDFPEIDFKVSIGGPVDTSNLFYVHDFGDQLENSLSISNGLFIGGSFDNMKVILNDSPTKAEGIRFFIGYSGWEKDQLNEELEGKSWIVVNGIKKETILNTKNDRLWKDIMSRLGGKFKVMSQFPKNPSDN